MYCLMLLLMKCAKDLRLLLYGINVFIPKDNQCARKCKKLEYLAVYVHAFMGS